MIFSVVIPVYNVKDYLPKCIDSVLAQDFEDYEVILIDDGSTDGESGAICDRYAAAHPERIRAIHKPNGGVGEARNVGIEAAQGEYLIFIDSDDYIAPNMFRVLADAVARFGSDIIGFGAALEANGTYANEVNKRGRACCLASGGRSVPDTVDSVTGALPQFIEVTADYAPRLADKFFGRYALMTDSPFARQTVRKDLLLTGSLTVEKGVESKHSLLVSPTGSKKILRGYFSEASIARLEAGTNAAPVAAVVFDLLKGSVIIESKGIVAATFTERLCTLSDLRSDTVRAGSLFFTGNQLKNIAERSDKGTVRINYDGYNEGMIKNYL